MMAVTVGNMGISGEGRGGGREGGRGRGGGREGGRGNVAGHVGGLLADLVSLGSREGV